jgi:polysaccharide biosynthesis transport protein
MIEPAAIERSDGGGAWLINHLPTILWHRRLYVIIPAVLLFVAGVVTAYSLPTLYRSEATMLVESQDLPTDIVQAPGTGEIEKRIAKIREQVLSRGDLISLIEQNNLYEAERRSNPVSYVVDKMRKATTVGALAGDIGGSTPASGSNVIAIKMAFDYPEPAKAQTVMQSYVTQFLRMDSDQIEDQANLTVRFLSEQAAKLQTQVQAIERQITELKASNGAALAGVGGTTFMDTGSFTAQITALENQNRQLLAQARGGAADPALAAAEAALSVAESTYSDSHPDVITARERVASLKRGGQRGGGPSSVVQEQIQSNNIAIAQLMAQRDAAMSRVNASMTRQAGAPAIMERAMQLDAQANNIRQQYARVSTDLLRAQSSARLANEQRAERLSLVEPPNLPDEPNWPNRPIVIAGGAAAGLALGFLLALLVELLNRPMRSPAQLQSMGLPVLGVVPILQTNPRKKRFAFFRKREAGLA